MALFMIRSGAVAGCIRMLFAFSGEPVLLMTHLLILCYPEENSASLSSSIMY